MIFCRHFTRLKARETNAHHCGTKYLTSNWLKRVQYWAYSNKIRFMLREKTEIY